MLFYTGLRRCGSAVGGGTCCKRQGNASDREGWDDSRSAYFAGVEDNARCGALWRSCIHRECKGAAIHKESFGNAFAKAARIAGVKKSCHDLRNVAAIRCAENGATVPQINAIFGWKGYKMALHYIEAANRKRPAAETMEK